MVLNPEQEPVRIQFTLSLSASELLEEYIQRKGVKSASTVLSAWAESYLESEDFSRRLNFLRAQDERKNQFLDQ
ncbi:MAG: hypothetical protein ACFB2W_00735 [Leptolyngbyaceae cyanobacterium]